MSKKPISLITLTALSIDEINSIFHKASEFSKGSSALNSLEQNRSHTVALVFFESSTRTRISFQTAAVRLGLFPILLDSKRGSSLDKGESYEDTLLNIAAMNPKALVIRCGEELSLSEFVSQKNLNFTIPIINAGWGSSGHPTQGLLDLFTIREKRGSLSDLKLLIIGDVLHSRVASSHFELAEKFGYEIAVAGPKEFHPQAQSVKIFQKLEEGLRWANALLVLRIQKERHKQDFLIDQYTQEFGLTAHNINHFSREGLVLHPGPINWGLEIGEEIKNDERLMILQQVSNGVYIRQAVYKFCFGEI